MPVSPLGGYGAPDSMQEECYKGGKREGNPEIQANTESEERASGADQTTDTPHQAKKEVNISEVKKSKQQGRESAFKSKKPTARKKYRGRRNPWINS